MRLRGSDNFNISQWVRKRNRGQEAVKVPTHHNKCTNLHIGCHSSERAWLILRRPMRRKQGDGCMVECPLWLGGTTARLHFSCSLSRLSIFMARAIKASWLEGCSVETIWSFMDQRVHGRRGRADKRRSGRCQLPKYRTQWHNQDTLQVSRWSSIKECVDEESQ